MADEKQLKKDLEFERALVEKLCIELGRVKAACLGYQILLDGHVNINEKIAEKMKIYEDNELLTKVNAESFVAYKVKRVDDD